MKFSDEIKAQALSLLATSEEVFINEKSEVFTNESYAQAAGVPYEKVSESSLAEEVAETEELKEKKKPTPPKK